MPYMLPTFPKNMVYIIRADGTEEKREIPYGRSSLEILRDVLPYKDFDISVHFSREHEEPGALISMVLDDHGWDYKEVWHSPNHVEHVPTKAKHPVNEKATELYWSVCQPGATHMIVGDVALIHDSRY